MPLSERNWVKTSHISGLSARQVIMSDEWSLYESSGE